MGKSTDIYDRGLKIPFTKPEREKLRATAKAYDLSDSTLVRLLIMGALERGGGQVTDLLRRGEKSLAGGPQVRTRQGRNFRRFWTWVAPMEWAYGEWRLFSHRPRGRNSPAAKKDIDQWWHLTHQRYGGIMLPVAFNLEKAQEEAVLWIEQHGEEAIKREELGEPRMET